MPIKRVLPEELKRRMKQGNPPEPDVVLLKEGNGAALVSVDEIKNAGTSDDNISDVLGDMDSDRVLAFKISDSGVDRDGDTINVLGWELAHFKQGGSVLWGHNASSPFNVLAKPLQTFVRGGSLFSIAEFAPKEINPLADTVFRMLKEGFVKGTSVGFRPIDMERAADREADGHFFPLNFLKQELTEFSITPVPSNPRALLQAKSLGINTAPVASWCSAVLDGGMAAPEGITKEMIETFWKTGREEEPVISIPHVAVADPELPSQEEKAEVSDTQKGVEETVEEEVQTEHSVTMERLLELTEQALTELKEENTHV